MNKDVIHFGKSFQKYSLKDVIHLSYVTFENPFPSLSLLIFFTHYRFLRKSHAVDQNNFWLQYLCFCQIATNKCQINKMYDLFSGRLICVVFSVFLDNKQLRRVKTDII